MLDSQRFMLEDQPVGVPEAKTVYPNIKEVLEFARVAQPNPPLIIHTEPDTPGWQLIFDPLPNEVVIDKRKNNAFAGTTLGSWIPTDAEIVVVGFQTDFSVRATCSAALGRGNEVILLREAHATFDRIEVLNGGGAEIEAELEEAGVHVFEMKDLPGYFCG
ncbi:Isochorismatase-like protein [Ephemerocybe angulata]|uniref:Isochorismatase-like protein n=1 Tax=Ephemerocybe angulata TaxID=980116 RepID=A0A8H6I1K4_9AGAR|nr:Isochorismatase-like protein [Tulosesus angulatus]